MTETMTYFCEVCGVDVDSTLNFKRFGKPFCSLDHMEQFIKVREKSLGLGDEQCDDKLDERTEKKGQG